MGVSLNKLWEIVKDRKAWCVAVHGVTKNGTWLSGCTTKFARILGKKFGLGKKKCKKHILKLTEKKAESDRMHKRKYLLQAMTMIIVVQKRLRHLPKALSLLEIWSNLKLTDLEI